MSALLGRFGPFSMSICYLANYPRSRFALELSIVSAITKDPKCIVCIEDLVVYHISMLTSIQVQVGKI